MVARFPYLYMMPRLKVGQVTPIRTFKNFGHKRQRDPTFTVIWQGFLTFSFISLGINWSKVRKMIFGDKEPELELKEKYSVTVTDKAAAEQT